MARWNCVCECGNTTVVSSSQLKSRKTQSCGCLQKQRTAEANTTHGGRYERLHNTWANMKNRCSNPNYSEYHNYGGRGITVCDEWLEYEPFREWALSQGYDANAERGKYTIDRIDVNKGYSPSNCRFADMRTQANNMTNNIRYTINGVRKTLSEWALFYNIPYDKLYYQVRTKGLPIEEIVMAM